MLTKNFAMLSESEKLELLFLQGEKINLLEEKIKKLEASLNKNKKNSKNSHKPPSSDQEKKTRSLRKKSGKKAGGQPGHKGHNLKMSKNPDEVYYHSISHCECCGGKLNKKPSKIVKRQVFEIPNPSFFVTEHQAEVKKCGDCGYANISDFPGEIKRQTQYGPRAKSLMVYLSQEQLLPYK